MRSMAGGCLPTHTHKDLRHLICEGTKVKGERERERENEREYTTNEGNRTQLLLRQKRMALYNTFTFLV